MLLDRGVNGWPVNAEVHLYETLPNTTHLGHIAQFEGEGDAIDDRRRSLICTR